MTPRTGFSQVVTGNIVGTVTDTTGAVIPQARVTAKDLDTGVETTTTTNNQGAYSIRFLPIGNYQVTIKVDGFAPNLYPKFALELDKTFKVDAALRVGSTTSTAVVTAERYSELLNTSDASLGIALTNEEVESIPLNGQNFTATTIYQPGAVNTAAGGGVSSANGYERDTSNNDLASTNGNRTQDNNYLVDGIVINQLYNNLVGYNPAPEAIQQMKVISANAPAEYGNVNGGDVLVELKTGTSHFHGSAYDFLQNQLLDANSWGNKHANPIININKFTRSQFGGTIGGPIWARKKLFFFGDYEGVLSHTAGTSTASVFTAAMRTGDFSALLHPPTSGTTYKAIQLYDTQNNFAPYANNQVTISNPVAQYLFAHPSLYPLPNATPTDAIIAGNLHGPSSSYVVNNQWDVKIEWDPRDSDKFTGFYTDSQPYDGSISVMPISFPAKNKYPTHIAGVSWIHVLSGSIVNNAHAGFTRVNWINSIPSDPTGLFGTSGDSLVGVPLPYPQSYAGFTAQSISNSFTTVGNSANLQVLLDNEYSYDDNLTWQHGMHLFAMGAQAIRYEENLYTAENYGFLGSLSYTGSFTSNPNVSSGGTGFGGADFVLNRVTTAHLAENGGLNGTRQWRWAGFFQDDWRVSRALTLNLGVRYEFDQPWYEVHNKAANVVISGPNAGLVEYPGSVPAGAPAGSIVCPNRACYNPTYNQIMPRLGFAFQVNPRLVVRAGYGATSFSEGNLAMIGVPPYQLAFAKTALAPTKTNGGSPYTVQSGFTSVPGSSFYSTNGGFGTIQPNMQPQYVQEWNLTLGYSLNGSTSLNLGYVGETGDHLRNYRNANQLTAPGATAPFAALVGQGGSLFETMSEAMMNYNALQATLRHQMARGLTYTVNYTYAHALTNSSGFYGVAQISGQNGAPQNGYNSHADYGPAPQDVRHNISMLGQYALPFGQGRHFFPQANRLMDGVIGGWQLSGSVLMYSGYPIEINAPSESQVNSDGQARANHYRPLIIKNRNIVNWFGTDPSAVPCTQPGVDNGVCAYGVPAVGSFGSASVNSERAPGYRDVASSFYKDFHITEGHSISFRADVFNLFNIADYGNPSNSVTATAWGQITAVRSSSRAAQLSLKYHF